MVMSGRVTRSSSSKAAAVEASQRVEAADEEAASATSEVEDVAESTATLVEEEEDEETTLGIVEDTLHSLGPNVVIIAKGPDPSEVVTATSEADEGEEVVNDNVIAQPHQTPALITAAAALGMPVVSLNSVTASRAATTVTLKYAGGGGGNESGVSDGVGNSVSGGSGVTLVPVIAGRRTVHLSSKGGQVVVTNTGAAGAAGAATSSVVGAQNVVLVRKAVGKPNSASEPSQTSTKHVEVLHHHHHTESTSTSTTTTVSPRSAAANNNAAAAATAKATSASNATPTSKGRSHASDDDEEEEGGEKMIDASEYRMVDPGCSYTTLTAANGRNTPPTSHGPPPPPHPPPRAPRRRLNGIVRKLFIHHPHAPSTPAPDIHDFQHARQVSALQSLRGGGRAQCRPRGRCDHARL